MQSKISIPARLYPDDKEREQLDILMHKFGNCRRRAYSMLKKGISKSEIERKLQEEISINARYVKDAYLSVKDLPPHITFGGKRNQEFLEKGKITKEEWHRRRNSVVLSRGEKTKAGNLNTRIVGNTLRIRVLNDYEAKWIYPKLYIPQKYLDRYGRLLDGKGKTLYTIMLKRKGNHYFVKIIIESEQPVISEPKRVMALDINAGHIDFAIMDRNKNLSAVGKIDTNEIESAGANKAKNLLHKTVDKISNIARHYDAEVIAGNLNTGKFKNTRKANRKVHRIPQYKFCSIMNYKLPMQGVVFQVKSEAYTTKLGNAISPLIGLDVHKSSSICFALKQVDYNLFRELLQGVSKNEGNGIPMGKLTEGSRLILPHVRAIFHAMKETEATRQFLIVGDYPILILGWRSPVPFSSLVDVVSSKFWR
jgi:IS605 OrfB family transposase